MLLVEKYWKYHEVSFNNSFNNGMKFVKEYFKTLERL